MDKRFLKRVAICEVVLLTGGLFPAPFHPYDYIKSKFDHKIAKVEQSIPVNFTPRMLFPYELPKDSASDMFPVSYFYANKEKYLSR